MAEQSIQVLSGSTQSPQPKAQSRFLATRAFKLNVSSTPTVEFRVLGQKGLSGFRVSSFSLGLMILGSTWTLKSLPF